MNLEPGYSLGSTWGDRLWSDEHFIGCWRDLDGLLSQSEEKFSARSRLAAIEAKDELIQIVIQMLVPYRALVGSKNPTFEQRRSLVRSGHQIFPVTQVTLDLTMMVVALHLEVGIEPVGANGAPGFDT